MPSNLQQIPISCHWVLQIIFLVCSVPQL